MSQHLEEGRFARPSVAQVRETVQDHQACTRGAPVLARRPWGGRQRQDLRLLRLLAEEGKGVAERVDL
jgi:hypothetical protein